MGFTKKNYLRNHSRKENLFSCKKLTIDYTFLDHEKL
jgi:hypothetical protein